MSVGILCTELCTCKECANSDEDFQENNDEELEEGDADANGEKFNWTIFQLNIYGWSLIMCQ